MNVVKVKLLMATLLSLMVGSAGCATAQQNLTASSDPSQVILNSDQTVVKPAATNANRLGESASLATKNQLATSPTAQLAQASFHETVQPRTNTSAVAPLITLGPSDNLLAMVEQSSGVVLLDFYADWCGPCRTQGGILHEMERTASQNSASIIKVNIDQHRQLAKAFNVTRLPTLILVKNGQIIERQTGLANHQKVAALLSR